MAMSAELTLHKLEGYSNSVINQIQFQSKLTDPGYKRVKAVNKIISTIHMYVILQK